MDFHRQADTQADDQVDTQADAPTPHTGAPAPSSRIPRRRRSSVGRGLAFEPAEGWPLDRVLVGVGTLRTLRQLVRHHRLRNASTEWIRAWDIALWSGMTSQGSRYAMERLRSAGVLKTASRAELRRAERFTIDAYHPLTRAFEHLFDAERLTLAARQARRRY